MEPVKIDLVFPVFPEPAGQATYDDETGIVSMPLDYWLQIAEYAIEVDEVKQKYNILTKE